MTRTKNITTGTNFYLQQFLNASFKRRRNSAGSHDQKYCEEQQAHEAALQKTVSSNLKVANERLEKLSGEVSNITKSLEFTQKQLENETKVIKKDIKTLQKHLNEVKKDLLDPENITNKLIELEYSSRRNNLRIDGRNKQRFLGKL